ncbi:MAG: hypothetical protein RJB66_1931 [Pseudomonadota bacterium]|jgi:hypothetical protein
MKKTTFVESGSHFLIAGVMALTMATSACNEKSSSRQQRPARRAAAMKNNTPGPNNQQPSPADTATQPNTPPLLPRLNSPDEPSKSFEKPTGRSGTQETLTRSNPFPTSEKEKTASPTTPSPQTQVFGDLQHVLTQLHNIYLNAWYAVNKDKSSRPRNFFEDIAAKIQNLSPIISLKDGEGTPASINDRCDRYRLVHTHDLVKNRQRLLLYDCTTKSYLPEALLTYRVQGNEWQIATTPQTLDFILPNQMGFLSTISFKPLCLVTIEKESSSTKISKALCKEWGQQLSSSKAQDRKTILFNLLKYDRSAVNVLEVEAQYIDYDGSNQVCRSGMMRRKAPSSKEVIYLDDEDVSECKPSPLDQPKQAFPITAPEMQPPQAETNTGHRPSPTGEPMVKNPRAMAIPMNPTAQNTPPIMNPNEGEMNFGNPEIQVPPVLEPAAPSVDTSEAITPVMEPPMDSQEPMAPANFGEVETL